MKIEKDGIEYISDSQLTIKNDNGYWMFLEKLLSKMFC